MRVLIEGWYYYQKPANSEVFITKIAVFFAWRHKKPIKNKHKLEKSINFIKKRMFVLYDAMQKRAILIIYAKKIIYMSSNIARGDISRAGIIFIQGLQLRVLLECGYYSREGLIWGNTVDISKIHSAQHEKLFCFVLFKSTPNYPWYPYLVVDIQANISINH